MKKEKPLDGKAPARGLEISDEYVNNRSNTHINPIDFEYTVDNIPYAIVDLLLDNYSLLDIGCATAGYWRLLKRCKSIVGVDYSKKMLSVAAEYAEKYNFKESEFIHSSVEKFTTDRKFDVIVCLVLGHYVPCSRKIIKKLHSFLRPGGILVLSFQTPKNIKDIVRGFFKKNPLFIYPNQFVSLVTGIGFELKLTMNNKLNQFSIFDSSYYCVLQKRS